MTDTNERNVPGIPKCAAVETLLSGYIDGELTQQESQKVRIHIETCRHCGQLYADLSRLKEQMQQLSYPRTDEELLAALENDLTARASAGIGWALLGLGIVIVAGVGLFQFFTSPEVPGVVQFFYGLFMLGGLGLFISVLRQRIMTYKNDRYRKVKL